MAINIIEKRRQATLENSKIIKKFRIYRKTMLNCSKASFFVYLIGRMKNKIFSVPIKTISAFLVVLILINLLFLNRELGVFGWIMRILFVFIGLMGMLCEFDYAALKEGSLVMRYFNKTLAK